MILSLDDLATRYHALPSDVIQRADTFDLYVMTVAAKWAKKQRDKADGKHTPQEPTKLTEQQMLDMVKYAKGTVK